MYPPAVLHARCDHLVVAAAVSQREYVQFHQASPGAAVLES